MFKKKLQELDRILSAKINEVSEKLSLLIKQINDHWNSENVEKNYVYINYLYSDMEFLELDGLNVNLLHSIACHLIEADSFMNFNKPDIELISMFEKAIKKYNDIHIKQLGYSPACYDLWNLTLEKCKKNI